LQIVGIGFIAVIIFDAYSITMILQMNIVGNKNVDFK